MSRADTDREIARLDPDHRIAELELQNTALRRQRDDLIQAQVEDELRDHIRWILLERPFR